jgi:hypothetical protein
MYTRVSYCIQCNSLQTYWRFPFVKWLKCETICRQPSFLLIIVLSRVSVEISYFVREAVKFYVDTILHFYFKKYNMKILSVSLIWDIVCREKPHRNNCYINVIYMLLFSNSSNTKKIRLSQTYYSYCRYSSIFHIVLSFDTLLPVPFSFLFKRITTCCICWKLKKRSTSYIDWFYVKEGFINDRVIYANLMKHSLPICK